MTKLPLLAVLGLLMAPGCTTRNPHYPDAGQPGADASPRLDQGTARLDGPMLDRSPWDVRPPPPERRVWDLPSVLPDGPLPDQPAPPPDGPLPDQPAPAPDLAAPDWAGPDAAPKPDLSICPPGLTRCGLVCVDLQRDAAHCGKCGAKCGPGTGCVTGGCAAPSAWRSSLYSANWIPGLQDSQGRFLHDFSYAGYHMGDKAIPDKIPGMWVSVTSSPYNADPTGKADSTSAIQKALDDVGTKGGGVVFLPPGTYRVRPPAGANAALQIKYSKVVLRGAGRAKTFIYNDEYKMRSRVVIYARPISSASWTSPVGTQRPILSDAGNRARDVRLLVYTTSSFTKGDWVVVRSDATNDWIKQHGMTGTWTPSNMRGPIFLRQVTGLTNSRVYLDIPLRYPLLVRDNARIYKARPHLSEVGIEDFSVGNREHPGSGWGDSDYTKSGTGAYDAHASRAISFAYVVNGWARRVGTYRPAGNKKLVHTLSDGLQLYMSRNITVQDCVFMHPQYEGGGGNGYTFVMQGSDNLVDSCASVSARHAYSFKSIQTSGNVVRASSSVSPRLATDFHMHLSAANLLDGLVLDGDFIDATYRPYGTTIHGHTTTQSAIWNTRGIRYHKSAGSTLVDSRQFGWGVVTGTRGAAFGVRTTPTKDSKETAPEDLREGVGGGGALAPESLYADQLARRKNGGKAPPLTGPNMVTLSPVADTYVRDGANANNNFGGATAINVKVTGANSGYNRVALLRFDLSKLKLPIAKARLVVYGRTTDGGGTHVVTAAYGVSDDTWGEKSVTWSSRPTLSTYQSRLTVHNKDAWRVFDVSGWVRTQQAGDNTASIALAQPAGQAGLVVSLHSREHKDHRPRLELIPFPGAPLAVKSIVSSSPASSGTSAKATLDGDLATRFSSADFGAQITYDLGAVQTVTGLAVAHQSGDQRIAYFEVQVSSDNKSWRTLRGGQSEGDNRALQYLALPKTQARYVRYVGLGNSSNAWNSITEVRIFGP